MIDRELDIQTADGAMNTFVTHPEEGGPHPVVLFYPDTQHGFVFPKREGMYQQAGAERHWERLIALFRRNLGQGGLP